MVHAAPRRLLSFKVGGELGEMVVEAQEKQFLGPRSSMALRVITSQKKVVKKVVNMAG